MSILASTSSPPQPGLSDFITLIIIGIPALLIIWRTGVLRGSGVAGPPRIRGGDPLGLLLLTLIGGAFLWMMVQALFISPDQVKAATAPTTLPGIAPKKLVMAQIVSTLIATLFMIVANFTLRPTGLRDLGLHRSGIRRGLIAAFVGAIPSIWLVLLAVVGTELVWRKIGYQHPREHDLLRFLRETGEPATTGMILISALLAAPVFEEILFRGHLQTLLVYVFDRLANPPARHEHSFLPEFADRALPDPSARVRWTAVVIASLLFMAVHPMWTWPPIFLLSLCLGYIYERTGNLWVAIFIHGLFNLTSTILFTLQAR